MNKDPNYTYIETKISGTPEQFAAFAIDWCRGSYRVIGLVPRIIMNSDGSLNSVEYVQAPKEILYTNTFDDAFEILNKKTPDKFKFDPGYRYIYRAKGEYEGMARTASKYHLVDKDLSTSLCGAVNKDENGYAMTFKNEPVIPGYVCGHCATWARKRARDNG